MEALSDTWPQMGLKTFRATRIIFILVGFLYIHAMSKIHHHHNSLGSMVCKKGTKNFGTGVDIGYLKYPASLSMSARLSDIFKYMMIYALSTIYQRFLNTSSRI